MKNIFDSKFFILIALAFIAGSCRIATKKQIAVTENILPADTIKTIISDKNHDKNVEEHTEDTDSLKLAEILADALEIATKNVHKETFHTDYEATANDEYDVKVDIKLDYHFTKKYSHLIIRRMIWNNLFIDIYSKKNNTFEKVLAIEQWLFTYVNDTIRDINGDGLNDFVINGYGASGCCLKAFSIVYLLRHDRKTFSNDFDFINPTFSPNEKIIRGICYGHSGQTEMYKYKWNGERVDTLEYVYYERNQENERTGKVIISTKPPYIDNNKVLKRLNSVPNEYKKIEGYYWFEGGDE